MENGGKETTETKRERKPEREIVGAAGQEGECANSGGEGSGSSAALPPDTGSPQKPGRD